MLLALAAATRATCPRRRVGAVFLNAAGHVVATGYNGGSRNTGHCIDSPCAGSLAESGTQLEACDATHAEINALAQCSNVLEVAEIYVTTIPCPSCMKALRATGAKDIYYLHDYPSSRRSREIWEAHCGTAFRLVQVDLDGLDQSLNTLVATYRGLRPRAFE
jgi:dCMP deaminase